MVVEVLQSNGVAHESHEEVTSTSTVHTYSIFESLTVDPTSLANSPSTTTPSPLPGFHNFQNSPMKIYSQPAESPDGIHAWVTEDIEPRYSYNDDAKTSLDPFDFIKDIPPSASLAELKPLDPNDYLSPDTSASSYKHETSPSSSSPGNQYKGAITNNNTFLGYNGTPEPVSTTTSPCSSASLISVKQEHQQMTSVIHHDLDDIASFIGSAINETNITQNFSSMALPDTLDCLNADVDLEEWINNIGTSNTVKTEPSDPLINSTMSPPHLSPSLVSSQLPHSSTLGNMGDYQINSHQINQTSSPMLQSLLAAGTVTNNNYLNGLVNDSSLHKQDVTMPILQARLTQGLKDVNMSHNILKSSSMYTQYYIHKDSMPHSTDLNNYTTVSTTDDLLKYDVRAYLDKTHLASPESSDMSDLKGKNRNRIRSTKLPIRTEGTKDKPIHHCTVCQRGFLNKSNIKVHLRTHTGEKPFKCETCSKTFRQKAHLLKHHQIHRRGARE